VSFLEQPVESVFTGKNILFSWNDAQNKDNKSKHGVSFSEAVTVFSDGSAQLIENDGEFIIIGLSSNSRVLTINYCPGCESAIQLGSTRKATNEEINKHCKQRAQRNQNPYADRLKNEGYTVMIRHGNAQINEKCCIG
jgi:uncharacterized DUF497 family protein